MGRHCSVLSLSPFDVRIRTHLCTFTVLFQIVHAIISLNVKGVRSQVFVLICYWFPSRKSRWWRTWTMAFSISIDRNRAHLSCSPWMAFIVSKFDNIQNIRFENYSEKLSSSILKGFCTPPLHKRANIIVFSIQTRCRWCCQRKYIAIIFTFLSNDASFITLHRMALRVDCLKKMKQAERRKKTEMNFIVPSIWFGVFLSCRHELTFVFGVGK